MTPDLPKYVLQFAGYCLIAHFALSFLLHRMLRKAEPLHGKLFAYPPFGQFVTKLPWQLSVKYLWPWASVPSELAAQPALARMFFGLTRLSGFLAIAGFLGFLGMILIKEVAFIGAS